MMKSGQHIVSLSLGTVAEPSAVVVIDPRTEFERPKDQGRKRGWENYFNVTHITRFPARLPIPVIVSRVTQLMSDERLAKNCHLLLDITSTGPAPVRVFESSGLYPESIDLTNTGSEDRSGGVRRVPLRDVIGAAQVVFQTRRLDVAEDLKLASTLLGDFHSYDHKRADRGLDLRGGRNSDLVLALAVGLWWGDDLMWGDDDTDRTPPVRFSGEHSWMRM
ncbi:MAG: hypothetical protein IID50_03575 [Proteobacteria bacterium]|nr:hypothetical protein [Pseudomonadota bacterium]